MFSENNEIFREWYITKPGIVLDKLIQDYTIKVKKIIFDLKWQFIIIINRTLAWL